MPPLVPAAISHYSYPQLRPAINHRYDCTDEFNSPSHVRLDLVGPDETGVALRSESRESVARRFDPGDKQHLARAREFVLVRRA